MKLKLEKRPCAIGVSINVRRQKHGDDNVTALDIPISAVMINGKELEEFLEWPGAAEGLFDKSNGSIEPTAAKMLPVLPIDGKFEESSADIYIGLAPDKLELRDVTITKVRLIRTSGGMTAMAFSIQCTPELTPKISKLMGKLDSKADISVKFGEILEEDSDEERQQNMPLAPDEVSNESRAH